MSNPFFDHPILNSPYARPERHWELDEDGQPTQKIVETRRRAEFITPIPKPKKRKRIDTQEELLLGDARGLSTKAQQYDLTSIINEVRGQMNEESFFVRHAYFLGANDPYSALKTTLRAEIDPDAWATLNSDTSRPFDKPTRGRIAVKVINHLGDEVMKVFRM